MKLFSRCVVLAVGFGLSLGGGASVAQSRPGRPPARPNAQDRIDKSRMQIAMMEGVLERAVEATHNHQLEEMMPAMFSFEGGSRARGFRLEGYGLFFDVDLPPLPRSVAWTFRVLDPQAVLGSDIEQMRRLAAQITDARVRQQMEQVVQRMEGKVATPGPRAAQAADAQPGQVRTLSASDTNAGEDGAARVEDPVRIYMAELRDQLTNVLVDIGPAMDLGADEWITIGAREVQPRLVPGAGGEQASLSLRIKGGDLAALRANRITRDEARKRVDVKEF